MMWAPRGVYFFFEPGETFPTGSRVTRIGTHALNTGSRTTLWHRLSQHRGTRSPFGGNHRGSIFRLLVGEALMRRDPELFVESWGMKKAPADSDAKQREKAHEARVSDYLGGTSVLALPINDAPGPDNRRGFLERNAIALLSQQALSPEACISGSWLGLHSGRERVRRSGLWNNRHVNERHDPAFLDVMEHLIDEIPTPSEVVGHST
ncbi:hypothetical protein IB235_23735 [Paracoccus sp. PAR01]|nr:hypothetical protein [Paracoccus sp. PAR01]